MSVCWLTPMGLCVATVKTYVVILFGGEDAIANGKINIATVIVSTRNTVKATVLLTKHVFDGDTLFLRMFKFLAPCVLLEISFCFESDFLTFCFPF